LREEYRLREFDNMVVYLMTLRLFSII
jgi:hypothetical protein